MDTSASIGGDRLAQFANELSTVNHRSSQEASCQELTKDTQEGKVYVIGVCFYQYGGKLSKKIYPYLSKKCHYTDEHVVVRVSGQCKVVRVMVGQNDRITNEFKEKAVRYISNTPPSQAEIADVQEENSWKSNWKDWKGGRAALLER